MEFTGERFIPNISQTDVELAVEHYHRYLTVLPFVKGRSVLDIACGEGFGTALLSTEATEVLGIDIDQECILHASNRYGSSNEKIRFMNASMQAIPLEDGCIDVIVSFESLEHLSATDQRKFIKEVARVLRPDGVLFVSTPNTAIYGEQIPTENPFHLHELDFAEFKALLHSEFQHLKIYEQGFEVVSVIADREGDVKIKLPVKSWRPNPDLPSGKYLLAVASKRTIAEEDISSIILDTGKNFHELSKRYWLANLELENVGKWAQSLDKMREKQECEIALLQAKLQALNSGERVNQTTNDALRLELEVLSRAITELRNDLVKIVASDSHNIQFVAQQAKTIYELELRNRELLLRQDQLLLEGQARLRERESILQEELSEVRQRLESAEKALETNAAELDMLARANVAARENSETYRQRFELLRLNEESLKSAASDAESDAAFSRRLLGEAEAQLQRIYESDGWRLLTRYYNLKGKYLNEGSWQYKFLRRLLKGKTAATSLRSDAQVLPETRLTASLVEEFLPEHIVIPHFESITVSIVIPVYNAFEMNLKCIRSVVEHTDAVAYEIILADDASTDRTAEIENYVDNLVISRSEQNLGFLKNCNKASKLAKGPYIHFLNNDTEVTKGWLSSLTQIMERDQDVGMLGSMLIYPDGTLQEAGGIIWKDASGWNYGNRSDKDNPEFNYLKEVDYVSGASILIRMAIWKELGGFDEQFSPAYCEDSDFAFQVRKAGYKVMYQPLSKVIHYEGYSHGTDTQAASVVNIKSYQIANGKKFFEKWRDTLEASHFDNGCQVFWARDRSIGKKAVLFIDHYVPHIDKDAGSKTTFHYLKLFLKLGYNVKFIGDNFFRHEPYTCLLQQLGIEVLYGPHYANNWQEWLKDHAEKFEFVYLNRPHISIKYIRFIRQHVKAKIIYYGHDLHFLRELRRYQVDGNEQHLNESRKWRNTESSLLNEADLSLTPSVDEFKTIRKEFPEANIQVMRPYVFELDKVNAPHFDSRSDILFVGGFNHQPNVDAVIWFIKSVWPQIASKLEHAKFVIVGSNPPEELNQILNERVLLKGFVSDEQLTRLYTHSRVVAVPLRYGAGVKGKTVEAMSHGVPIVATSIGLEGLPGQSDFLTPFESVDEFAAEVVRLYQDQDYWRLMSEKGTAYVRREFSEQKALEVLQSALATISMQETIVL